MTWLGISNGQMPGNKSTFPPAYQSKSRLHYYSTLFNTIEVNSSFYKIPLQHTCEKWAADVPGNFRFTLKLNRDITHAVNLNFEPGLLKKFMTVADGLGEKKGCLLIQLPGKTEIKHFKQLEQLLLQVSGHNQHGKWRIAVEFRHDSWYIPETSELLNEYGASMVLHDFSKAKNAVIADHAAFAYLRFHGPSGDYNGSYSDEELDKQADFIRQLTRTGRDVYVYFNNTAGDAYANALFLQACLSPGYNKPSS